MNPATRRPAIFRFLAARPHAEVTIEELIAAVYGDAPPSAAAASIRSMIVRLRTELVDHGGEIHFVGRGYRYTPGPTVPTFKEEATAYPWLPIALELHARGVGCRSIAAKFGTSHGTVRRQLTKAETREATHA